MVRERDVYFLAATISLIIFLAGLPAIVPAHAKIQASIAIRSDSDFGTCSCVSSGSGTSSDPYIISRLTLMSQNAPGILVDNSAGKIAKHFEMSGETITGGNGPPTQYPGVEFVDVNGLGVIIGPQNTFNGNEYGVLLEGSSNIVIDGGSSSAGSTINNNGIAGIAVHGGGSNTIANIQVNHNGIGIPEDFVSGGVGIELQSTTGNTITNVVLSEDAFSGLVLFSSSSNSISGISVHYPDFYGVVMDAGSGNIIQNSVVQTSDFVALWLRGGTANNMIISDFFSGNGPTGKEKTDGIVPYFSTALYLSSGASSNSIKNNFFGSNGGGSIIQDTGQVLNAVMSPVQVNNLYNDPSTGNEPTSPLSPSGPAGFGNTFCGAGEVITQGILNYPLC